MPIATHTRTVLPRTARKVEFVIVLGGFESVKPNEELVEPTFIDPVTGTAVWILDSGAVEVPIRYWLNGDLLRLALTAGWASRTRRKVPRWLKAQCFYQEHTYLAPRWEVVSDLLVEA